MYSDGGTYIAVVLLPSFHLPACPVNFLTRTVMPMITRAGIAAARAVKSIIRGTAAICPRGPLPDRFSRNEQTGVEMNMDSSQVHNPGKSGDSAGVIYKAPFAQRSVVLIT